MVGGGMRAVVPGYPGRGLGARRLRPRLLLALQEGVLLLPRFPRDGGSDDLLRPLVPALQLRLPRAPLPQGHRSRLANFSFTDCGKNDPELAKEMEKQFVDLLNEELKLQQVVAEEHSHHMNATLVEAKRQSTQYQREVEKCNAATETCEVAHERSEAAI